MLIPSLTTPPLTSVPTAHPALGSAWKAKKAALTRLIPFPGEWALKKCGSNHLRWKLMFVSVLVCLLKQ